MRRFVSLLALAVLAAVPAGAQSLNSFGSVYSRFGVGERQEFSTSQASALGLQGTALRSTVYQGRANPALAADQFVTSLGANMEFRAVQAEESGLDDAQLTDGGLGGLVVGLPLVSNTVGVALSYSPYSRVNYRTTSTGSFEDVDGDTVPFRVNFEGAGGLQAAGLALGVRPAEWIQLGARADVVFGLIEYRKRTEFPSDTLQTYAEARTTTATRVAGVTGTVGTLITARFSERNALTFGASFTLPATLSGDRVTTFGQSLDRDSLSTPVDGSVRLPLQASAGLTYYGGQSLTVAVDAVYEPWSDFDSDFALGGFTPAGTGGAAVSELRDRLRVGGGIEFVPAGGDRLAGYLSRVGYRLGGYYEQTLAQPGSQGIDAMAVTGGLSMPSLLPTARFDLGFEVGTRGQTGVTPLGQGLVRDLFFRGTITLNFGERWFVRRRFG